jgi:hypothetical protein
VEQIETQFQTEHTQKLAEKNRRKKSKKPAKKVHEDLMAVAKRKWPTEVRYHQSFVEIAAKT